MLIAVELHNREPRLSCFTLFSIGILITFCNKQQVVGTRSRVLFFTVVPCTPYCAYITTGIRFSRPKLTIQEGTQWNCPQYRAWRWTFYDPFIPTLTLFLWEWRYDAPRCDHKSMRLPRGGRLRSCAKAGQQVDSPSVHAPYPTAGYCVMWDEVFHFPGTVGGRYGTGQK